MTNLIEGPDVQAMQAGQLYKLEDGGTTKAGEKILSLKLVDELTSFVRERKKDEKDGMVKLGTITDQKLASLLYLLHATNLLGGVPTYTFNKDQEGRVESADIYADDCDKEGRIILRMLMQEK